jgi:hypothetical protein
MAAGPIFSGAELVKAFSVGVDANRCAYASTRPLLPRARNPGEPPTSTTRHVDGTSIRKAERIEVLFSEAVNIRGHDEVDKRQFRSIFVEFRSRAASLVILEQELRVDHLETQPAADVLVVFFRERPEHDAFALHFGIEDARSFREGHQVVDGVI